MKFDKNISCSNSLPLFISTDKEEDGSLHQQPDRDNARREVRGRQETGDGRDEEDVHQPETWTQIQIPLKTSVPLPPSGWGKRFV